MKYFVWLASIWIISCKAIPKHFKSNPLYFASNICPTIQDKSLKGSWDCSNHEFFFEIGENVTSTSLTDAEKFKLAFKGSYYLKFFESIHIDTKLAKLYMDSIKVDRVIDKTNHQGSLLFSCSACNRVAHVTFRNRQYPFPFFSTQPLESDVTSMHLDTINGFSRKMIISKNDGQSSMFLSPLIASKTKDKIAVYTLQTRDTSLIVDVFKSLKIKF